MRNPLRNSVVFISHPLECTRRHSATENYIRVVAWVDKGRHANGMGRKKKVEATVKGGADIACPTVGVPVKKKGGRPAKTVSTDAQKKACEAAYLGMPEERIAILCGFYDGGGTWAAYLTRNPEFAGQLKASRVAGEVDMTKRVMGAENGWQGSAWLLERTRGYVARQQLEHSGPGGKALTIAHQVLAAVSVGERG